MPEISVNVAAYNSGSFIAQTLDSVLAQTFTDWECIIVDDASTDDTAQVVQRYVERDARFKLIRIQPDAKKPFPNSRNVALAHSSGTWICPLDSDDWWEPWKLERQLAAVNARPGLVMCAACAQVWQDGQVVATTGAIRAATIGLDLLMACVTVNSVLIRRQVVVDLQGYDESLPLAEDWDLWVRTVMRHGEQAVAAVEEPSMYYRRHGHNTTTNHDRILHYDRVMVRRLLFRHGLLWKRPLMALRVVDTQFVRSMDTLVRAGRMWQARLRSIGVVSGNPFKRWRWSHAARAWCGKPIGADHGQARAGD